MTMIKRNAKFEEDKKGLTKLVLLSCTIFVCEREKKIVCLART